METKTFETYMQENGKELLPWQKEAAKALLSVVKEQQGGATGKTFLMKKPFGIYSSVWQRVRSLTISFERFIRSKKLVRN